MGMLPPQVLLQLSEASLAGMLQLREERKILEYYHSPAGRSVVVLEYESADEWVKEQGIIPILNYLEAEVYPLANGFEALKGMIESMKAMAT